MPTHFAILGDGAWGTAIALLLASRPGHRVSLWSAREENARILRERRENVRLLPGVPIPNEVHLTTDAAEAVAGCSLVVLAVPTVYLRRTLAPIASEISGPRPVLSLAKGLENETFLRPTEIIRQLLGPPAVGALSGPSHAEEVSRGLPTSLVAAADQPGLSERVQQWFTTDRFRVYTNPDLTGVELGGALKNVVGVAAGIGDGLGFGDNAKSALLTRGLVEMVRFGTALGADPHTFFGLAGLGDLITTCVSRHGRNRRVGERIGRGEKPADVLAGMDMVAEGVFTTRSVYQKAARLGINLPITTEVYRVLYEGKDPVAAVNDLMLREPTSERPL